MKRLTFFGQGYSAPKYKSCIKVWGLGASEFWTCRAPAYKEQSRVQAALRVQGFRSLGFREQGGLRVLRFRV